MHTSSPPHHVDPQPSNTEFWPRLLRVASEEFGHLVSRRPLTWLASALPTQAFTRSRTALLRSAGVQIGEGSLIQGPLLVTGTGANPCRDLCIGNFTMISGALHCDIGASIRIGNRVSIGHDVSLLTIDHQVGQEGLRAGTHRFGPIEIGDGAWIASRVIVLPGVRIGAGAIVAAGSVVTSDVADNSLVAGVPARVVRDLNPNIDADDGDAPGSRRRFLSQS